MPRADLPRGLLNGDSTHLPALIAALNDESTRLTDKKTQGRYQSPESDTKALLSCAWQTHWSRGTFDFIFRTCSLRLSAGELEGGH